MSIKDFKEKVMAYIKVNTTWKELHEILNYNVQYIDWYLKVEPTHLFHIQKRVNLLLIFSNSAFIFTISSVLMNVINVFKFNIHVSVHCSMTQ
jgi:hypothetical protein